MRSNRIALVIGTRPEAIKLSPVAQELARQGVRPLIVVTGQHPGLELRDHGLDGFDTVPLACAGLPDPMMHADLVRLSLVRILRLRNIDLVMVQGDTSSALGGAQAAKEAGCLLAHVEAGLRTHDPQQPWPEEPNRVAIDRLSDLMFAPTADNAANLRRERVDGTVHVTGNPGIDALASRIGPLPRRKRWRLLPRRTFQLLATCHRREHWGDGLTQLATALQTLAGDRGLSINLVLHPNPTVAAQMAALLGSNPAIRLVAPMSHDAMLAAMTACDLMLSDSGGVQEEAPALGVPLLVLREKTERSEAIDGGNAILMGMDSAEIVRTVRDLRRHPRVLDALSVPAMPFGDGRSAPRIAALTLAYLAEQDDARAERRT